MVLLLLHQVKIMINSVVMQRQLRMDTNRAQQSNHANAWVVHVDGVFGRQARAVGGNQCFGYM